ncbi:MAG: hypothetical protein HYX68_15060 [Planctomycetes bacterium]|nr:hypothetical protein [Planctomycetota bacterium]
MNTSALIFMLVVWSVILVMTGYCFFKLLTSARPLSGPEEPSGPTDVQPGDPGITDRPV